MTASRADGGLRKRVVAASPAAARGRHERARLSPQLRARAPRAPRAARALRRVEPVPAARRARRVQIFCRRNHARRAGGGAGRLRDRRGGEDEGARGPREGPAGRRRRRRARRDAGEGTAGEGGRAQGDDAARQGGVEERGREAVGRDLPRAGVGAHRPAGARVGGVQLHERALPGRLPVAAQV